MFKKKENTKLDPLVFLFIFSGLPLIIYPFIFIVSLMSLAGHTSNSTSIFLIIVTYLFLIGSLLYPVVYLFCIISFNLSKDKKNKFLFLKIPFIYLLVCVVLFILWSSFSASVNNNIGNNNSNFNIIEKKFDFTEININKAHNNKNYFNQ